MGYYVLAIILSTIGFLILPEPKEYSFKNWFLQFIAVLIIVYAGNITTHQSEYKQGQIDALSGKVKYHLVTGADSTTKWEEIK